MGGTASRHHLHNMTDFNIYVKYEKYDKVMTSMNGLAETNLNYSPLNVVEGFVGTGRTSFSTPWTLKDRPSGFNLIKAG